MLRYFFPKIVVPILYMCGNVDNAFAEDASDKAASAKLFFAKGEELFDEEEYLEAAVAFQRAYALSPHPAVLTNIGYCYEYANDHAKAATIYREYLDAPFEKDPDTVADIENRLATLKLMVGELHIKCRPDECTAEVDGVQKGKTKEGELVVIMAPGKYSVTVKRLDGSGEQTSSKAFRVEAGAKTNARFDFESTAEVGAPPPPERAASAPTVAPDSREGKTSTWTGKKIAFYALSGGALASGVMVTVFGALTLKANNEFKDSDNRDVDAHDAAKRNKVITNVSIGAASTLAVGAIIVKILDLRSSKQEKKGLALSLMLDSTLDSGSVVGFTGRF